MSNLFICLIFNCVTLSTFHAFFLFAFSCCYSFIVSFPWHLSLLLFLFSCYVFYFTLRFSYSFTCFSSVEIFSAADVVVRGSKHVRWWDPTSIFFLILYLLAFIVNNIGFLLVIILSAKIIFCNQGWMRGKNWSSWLESIDINLVVVNIKSFVMEWNECSTCPCYYHTFLSI